MSQKTGMDHLNSKSVLVYVCPEAGRCPVYLLDLYISKLPLKAAENDIFYARLLESVPTDPSAPWYSATPVGKHTLNDKVKKMCMAAGIQGNMTNHSLRATGAMQMYENGVPEKIIQGQDTNHWRDCALMRDQLHNNIKPYLPSSQLHRHRCTTPSTSPVISRCTAS